MNTPPYFPPSFADLSRLLRDDPKGVSFDLDKAIRLAYQQLYGLQAKIQNLPVYANNAAAIAGGLAVGDFYRTNADPSLVAVVV